MSKLIIVSNRLPVKIIATKNSKLDMQPSEGGLATGLKSYHEDEKSIWIGWSGYIPKDATEKENVDNLLKSKSFIPIFLTRKQIKNYYHGFSNATIWPLFHYFPEYTVFEETYWKEYKSVNEQFAQYILDHAEKNDTVWVHDFQLMLVPSILREKRPDLTIGFFLHIPFPSYEIIRIIPWRNEILMGMLGSDLIGFHIYDYARHYKSSIKRLLGFDVVFNQIKLEDRNVSIDVFPMGIDFNKFKKTTEKIQRMSIQEHSNEQREIDRFLLSSPDKKFILSIDRLDYTKGIPHRLKSFKLFIEKYPQYKGNVSLVMITVPSRESVERYKDLKTEIDVLVGNINGEYGTLNWTPVIYFYRAVHFEYLIALYSSADIALLTPLRDGMNLVAKEYVACKVNRQGVLILSEMAGASRELGAAVIVNPNNINETADAIYKAMNMSYEEKSEALSTMQNRVKRYDVYKWAEEFLKSLQNVKHKSIEKKAKNISLKKVDQLVLDFKNAQSRYLFLDYDGTLQRFFGDPKDAKPDKHLYKLLDTLAEYNNTYLILISGRSKETLEDWFGKKKYSLIAEHGIWNKEEGKKWRTNVTNNKEWKKSILPVLESYVDRTPGSLLEEKNYSLVWHYRKSDVDLGYLRASELIHDMSNLIANQGLEILEGNKVVEIKIVGINKGVAAKEFLIGEQADFILAIGDDETDEFLFKHLPTNAVTIKVGTENTLAKYCLSSYKSVRELLSKLIEKDK